jgi:glucosamine 6-phosphate synthetase-like amidotransferase/phosphosugar isomerase protein
MAFLTSTATRSYGGRSTSKARCRIQQIRKRMDCYTAVTAGKSRNGTSFPIALEGALKLKEISYIRAEGYAGGELKHGPIAVIDETMPVIVIAPHDRVFDKTVSNMQEVAARGGRMILITDAKGAEAAEGQPVVTLKLPTMRPLWRRWSMPSRCS